MSTTARIFLFVIIQFAAGLGCGCDLTNEKPSLNGFACTMDDLSGSMLVPGKPRGNETMIEGASITLYFDKEYSDPVNMEMVSSNKDGRFTIVSQKLPPAKDPKGYYYLSVTKNGYLTLREQISINARYREFRAALKKLE